MSALLLLLAAASCHGLSVGQLLERCSNSLSASLAPITWLNIADRTDGHSAAGYLDGRALDAAGLDLQILIVSPKFAGCNTLQRQRLVNTALGAELHSGKVHSVQMRCWTPAQWRDSGMPEAFAAAPCVELTSRLGFGESYEGHSSSQAGSLNRVDSPYGGLMPSAAYGADRRVSALPSARPAAAQVAPPAPPPAASASHDGGNLGDRDVGGGEATRDPAPTCIDPNKPKRWQRAIHKAESFGEYLAKRHTK